MSYPRDLDEYTEMELHAELDRRRQHHRAGSCDYCGRDVRNPPCRFPKRHVPRMVHPQKRAAPEETK